MCSIDKLTKVVDSIDASLEGGEVIEGEALLVVLRNYLRMEVGLHLSTSKDLGRDLISGYN